MSLAYECLHLKKNISWFDSVKRLQTLEELFEIWTWTQLGILSKPIGILNVDNYFDKLIEFIYEAVENEFVMKKYLDMVIFDSDPENLLFKMKEFKPVEVRKWTDSKNS